MSDTSDPATRLVETWSKFHAELLSLHSAVVRAGADAFTRGDPEEALRLGAELRGLKEVCSLAATVDQFVRTRLLPSASVIEDQVTPVVAEPLPHEGSVEPPAIAPDVEDARRVIVAAEAVSALVEVEAPEEASVPSPALAPVPDSSAAPRRIKPQAAREPRKTAVDRKAFFAEARELLELPEWNSVDLCRLKRIVCDGRGLVERLGRTSEEGRLIQDEIVHVRRAFDERHPDLEFFGFSPSRQHAEAHWQTFAEIYAAMQSAFECEKWLEDRASLETPERLVLLSGMAAVESWLYRFAIQVDPPVADDQARRLHDRIFAKKRPDEFIRWWLRDDVNAPGDDEVRKAAKEFTSEWPAVKERYAKQEAKRAALQALHSVLEAPCDDLFEERFLEAVAHCLLSGVPFSDRQLVGACVPYLALLIPVALEKPYKKLFEHIVAFLKTREGAAEVQLEGGDQEEEGVDGGQFAAAREYLRGKTLLFVGGRKGQTERRERYIRELGLRDLIWEDSEDTTNVGRLMERVGEFDVAFQLIRWSRHSYAKVLDKAKAQGKAVVRLTAGIGLNTLLHQVQEQLHLDPSPASATGAR